MRDWRQDMKDSQDAFVRLVWPMIKPYLGGGHIISVEDVSAEPFAKLLDQTSGIDYWQYVDEQGVMRGVASRVQRDQWKTLYRTFTIRKSRASGARTEYEKMMHAYHNSQEGWLWSHWLVQAYLNANGDTFNAAGAVTVADLCRYLDSGGPYAEKTVAGGNIMMVIDWKDMRGHGYQVYGVGVDPQLVLI